MKVKSVVKVMNFHALLRVPEARRKVDLAFEYERELKYIISSIVNNRIFKQEHLSLDLDPDAKELNIYFKFFTLYLLLKLLSIILKTKLLLILLVKPT